MTLSANEKRPLPLRVGEESEEEEEERMRGGTTKTGSSGSSPSGHSGRFTFTAGVAAGEEEDAAGEGTTKENVFLEAAGEEEAAAAITSEGERMLDSTPTEDVVEVGEAELLTISSDA